MIAKLCTWGKDRKAATDSSEKLADAEQRLIASNEREKANERNIASLKEALQFAHETGASDREAATNARKKLQEAESAAQEALDRESTTNEALEETRTALEVSSASEQRAASSEQRAARVVCDS